MLIRLGRSEIGAPKERAAAPFPTMTAWILKPSPRFRLLSLPPMIALCSCGRSIHSWTRPSNSFARGASSTRLSASIGWNRTARATAFLQVSDIGQGPIPNSAY